MFFGTFLILKGAINEDQLVDALSLQLKSIPPFIQVLKDGGFVDSKKILDIIEKQFSSDKDVISVIREEGILSNTDLDKVFEKQAEKKTPVGRILVDLEFITSSDLNKYLEEFHNTDQAKVETVQASGQEDSDEGSISAAALESLKELGIMDSGELEELETSVSSSEASQDIIVESDVDTDSNISSPQLDELKQKFDGERKAKMMKISSAIKETVENEGDTANIINSFYKEIHLVKGVGALMGSKLFGTFLDPIEAKIESLFGEPSAKINSWLKGNENIFDLVINTLWSLRELLVSGKTEEEIWNNEEWKREYVKTMSFFKN